MHMLGWEGTRFRGGTHLMELGLRCREGEHTRGKI